MKKVLFLVITIIGLCQSSFAQGADCASSEMLCTPTATFSASVGIPDVGAVGCLLTTPDPAFYTIFISEGGVFDVDINNTSVNDIDFAIWGPFASPSVSCVGNFPDGPIVDCSYSGAAVETINIPAALTGEVYVLLITNFDGTATDISLAPNAGNTASVSGPLGFTTAAAGPYSIVDPVVTLQTSPPSTDPNVTITSITGTGITNTATGTFDPSVAGVGTHTVTVDGTSYGCPVTSTTDITVTNVITNVVAEVTRCNGNVADEALCPDETDDVALVDVTVVFAAPISATYGLQLTEANLISPASPINIAPNTMGLVDSVFYTFKDLEIPADGATALNFQIDLYENTIATILDTENEALAAQDPCSCFQYACNEDDTFQAMLATGFIADPDYTQEYVLTDLAGNILDRDDNAIFDVTSLTPGTIYAIYGLSYLTADAGIVLAQSNIDDI